MNGLRFLSPKTHGILDYLIGVVLLLAPNLLGFADSEPAAVWVPRVVGIVILLQALVTDFEVGLIKVLPFRVHQILDYFIGAFLAVSPFLFAFADEPANAWLPHLVVGLLIIGEALVTHPQTREMRRA